LYSQKAHPSSCKKNTDHLAGFSGPVDKEAKRQYNNDMFEQDGGGRRPRLTDQLWISCG